MYRWYISFKKNGKKIKLFPVAAFCLVLIEYYDVIKCYSQIKQFYDIILVCIFFEIKSYSKHMLYRIFAHTV